MKAMIEDVLLIDAGNTRLKWACLSGAELARVGEVDYQARLEGWDPDLGNRRPSRIVLACVAGDEVRDCLVSWAQDKFGIKAENLVTPAAGWGIRNAYRVADQLGIDRWAAMIAAFRKYSGNICVIDAGSALTLDFIRADGRHEGGYIVPGLHRLSQCLVESTSLKSATVLAEGASQRMPGTSTAGCVSQGALQMLCSMIETSLQHYEQEVAAPVQCVLTGGDGEKLSSLLKIECKLEPDLVLQGIGMMAGNEADES